MPFGQPLRVLLLAAALVLVAAPAHGEWIANGVPVCTAIGTQWYSQIVSDGAGGCYVVWQDFRNGGDFGADLYAQRLTASGSVAPGWPVDGVPVCHAPGDQGGPMAPDGEGGLLVAWLDERNEGNAGLDIYAQRLLPDGAIAPGWPVNGVPVSVQAGYQRYPRITGDGSGGAYVAWRDQSSPQEAFLQRLLADGTIAPGWPALGQPICPIPALRIPYLAALEGGDVIVIYSDARDPSTSGDIYAVRFTPTGMVAPGWPAEGVPVCLAPGTIGNVDVVLDGSGGVYVRGSTCAARHPMTPTTSTTSTSMPNG